MGLLLFFLFLVLPLVELYVIIQVGGVIGVLPTLGLLLLTGFVGAALARSQGRQTWRRFNEAMSAGRMPAREVLDGAMIIVGGALLLSPGFITDVLGIALLVPPGRAGISWLLKRAAARTPQGRPVLFIYDRIPGMGRSRGARSGAEQRPPPRPPRSPASRPYDVDGSAREIDESEYRLPEGERDGGGERGSGG
jgi:UPF0716 protein FxsA